MGLPLLRRQADRTVMGEHGLPRDPAAGISCAAGGSGAPAQQDRPLAGRNQSSDGIALATGIIPAVHCNPFSTTLPKSGTLAIHLRTRERSSGLAVSALAGGTESGIACGGTGCDASGCSTAVTLVTVAGGGRAGAAAGVATSGTGTGAIRAGAGAGTEISCDFALTVGGACNADSALAGSAARAGSGLWLAKAWR